MRDFFEDFLPFALFGIAIISAIIGLATLALMWQCSSYESATGKPTKMQGGMCFIKDGGEWYAWEEYKHRLVTKGTMK